jgi:acyl-coenzyme A synthetase/AMP-(fatty) acid ligase
LIFGKIFEQARATPSRPAMFYHGLTIRYGEFAYWIASAHQFLEQQNLKRGSTALMVDVPCRLDGWVLDFALRSLGLNTLAVRVLDELPDLQLRDVGCVITTVRDLPIRVPGIGDGYKVIRIPQPLYLGQRAGAVPEMPDISQPEGGHILLTSGTTGARKKVLIGSESLSIRIARHCNIYSISDQSIVNLLDFAMWTGAGYKLPLCAWSKGGAAVFHNESGLHRSLRIAGTSHAVFTPEKLSEVLSAPPTEIPKNPGLKAFVAGAPLTERLAENAAALLTRNIFTFVASTEAGLWALTRIDRPGDLSSHIIHPSVEVQVVDAQGRPLPSGQIGAVRIRATDGVNGYLDDSAATREIFRDGYFYPGDLGEFRADGRLVLHGRESSVINLRGAKLAAEPIEQVLKEKLGADALCMLSVPGDGEMEDLHLVIQSQRKIPATEIMAEIKARMPDFPTVRIQFVSEMPRNEMGKLDRLALKRQLSAIPPTSRGTLMGSADS